MTAPARSSRRRAGKGGGGEPACHPRQQQDIARDRRFDQRVQDVSCPAVPVADQGCRSRVSPEVEVALQAPPEGPTHLREGPVRHAQQLESSGKALGEPPLDQEGGRPEHDDLERQPGASVLVPQALDRLGPPRHLLHLVQDQESAPAAGLSRLGPSRLPLFLDPGSSAQHGLIGGGVAGREAQRVDRLPREGGLARLPGPSEHLDEAPRLAQTGDERVEHGAVKRAPIGGHDGFLSTLSNFTQDPEHPARPSECGRGGVGEAAVSPSWSLTHGRPGGYGAHVPSGLDGSTGRRAP